MLNLSSLYSFLIFLLSISTTVLSIMLFTIRIPKSKIITQYNRARFTLAFAYAVIGILNCYKAFVCIENINLNLIQTFTLISCSYQALLFTFALLILIQPESVSTKKFLTHFGIITFVSIISLLLFHKIDNTSYTLCNRIISIIYAFQLILYILLFNNKYTKFLKQVEEYYNEEKDNRPRWVKRYFYMALTIGIIALICTYIPLSFRSCFILIIIAFYIFFAIKYCSYPSKFGYVIASITSQKKNPHNEISVIECEPDEIKTDQLLSRRERELQQAINKWVEEKKFQDNDIDRDEIAKSLGTDRDTLTSFFYNHMKIEFRVWRTQLRIEEAKRLLLKYPDLSISNIGQQVGFTDRSNFQKKFIEHNNMTPKNWRNKNLQS